MNSFPKRAVITLLPEWEPILNKLKKEKFYNCTRAEMFRYIISRGLKAIKENREDLDNDRTA